ncbi:hypothetical protein [Noviherbaspirillum galbum]|uniref:Uncharacterized protein n=1 Tax=Noviherbaspirillum galbum TaxID=2709383 RepID=A0A6B3SYT2_9BURK|nr:hypothetical protein [Noviherbaspirillum galbum]NEX64022.1 hypothetical protein [Noviherbaspirillum galbum]
MITRLHSLFVIALLFALQVPLAAGAQASSADADFLCGGRVEADTWQLWDQQVRAPFEQEMLPERLLGQGDTYALYDMQLYSQSLWSMAQQCGRIDRLREAAGLVAATYPSLEPAPAPATGRAWICRGGAICADNGLLGREVKLVSFQFLGLASFVANALATSDAPLSGKEKDFINDTVAIVTEHMLRWSGDYEINRLMQVRKAGLQDVRADDSFLLFSDQDLWPLTIYAELAGLRQWQVKQGLGATTAADGKLKQHLNALLQAFSARVSILNSPALRLANTDSADLDRGYWKRMAANAYAAYEGADSPVSCPAGVPRVDTAAIPQRADIGWDLSHARRLVQAVDAFERNRAALKSVFAVSEARLPLPTLPQAFAAMLLNGPWNGDTLRPLFANYWSGANGWFGVVAAPGCTAGTAPYGMTDSFPTGGYVTWARYLPMIGLLGRRLYDIAYSSAPDDRAFIERFYPNLGQGVPVRYRSLYMSMFLASLVHP